MGTTGRKKWIALSICVIAAIGIWLYGKEQVSIRKQSATKALHSPLRAAPPANREIKNPEATNGKAADLGDESEDSSKPVDCIVLSNGRHTADKYLGAATGEHDLEGGMDCPFQVSNTMPVFTLHFVGMPNNALGDIEVMHAGKLIQTITRKEFFEPEMLPREVQSIDGNFDGYQDLELLNDCGATGNCDYSFYLYDPAQNKFVYNEFLSGLGTPAFDASKRQINTNWNMSVDDWSSSTYEFQNGKYVEIERYVSDEDGTKTYELRDGKMVLVKSEKNDDR